MKPKLLPLSVAAVGLFIFAGPVAAQNPPRILYSASAYGFIAIFNESKVIREQGRQTDTTAVTGSRFSHNVQADGQAMDQRTGGAGAFPFSMRVASRASAVTSFGSIVFAGTAQVTSEGQYFLNTSPETPRTGFETERGEAGAGLSMAYNDVIHVESDTLAPGTPVTVEASLDALAFMEQVKTNVVLVQYPPTGPGFPATSGFELQPATTSGPGLLKGEARLTSRQPGVVWPPLDDRFLYPLAASPHKITVKAVAGGQITLSHSSDFGLHAETGQDIYAATATSAASYSLTCRSLTEGVRLRSESGHHYAPATGLSGLMQVHSTPSFLVLTAPAEGIFQKAVFTPAGLDWQDLPQSRLLMVPFDQTSGFFRVRQP